MINQALSTGEYVMNAAQKLRSTWTQRGFNAGQLNSNHLTNLYGKLNKTSGAPNFSAIRKIVKELQACIEIDNPLLLGVIVETRNHPRLAAIISHFARHLKIPIQVFFGTGNRGCLNTPNIEHMIGSGQVVLTKLEVDALPASYYNALFLRKEFWQALRGRHKILVFQTDSICCPNADYTLADFMAFDYIGSMWSRHRPVGMIIDGGNGGFSLRDWSKSVQCLSRFEPIHWPGGEDGYFAFHVELIGGEVGDEDSCARFGTQICFRHRSFGAHRIQSLPRNELEAFLYYCPEARELLI